MNLELARQIMQEQIDYLASKEYPYADNLDLHTQNGHSVEEVLCVSDYWANKHNLDKSKLCFTLADEEGGEDQGSYYHRILKIDHPVHGVGYIRYVGHYDSWSGTDWYNDPEMVTPVEKVVTITEWKPA